MTHRTLLQNFIAFFKRIVQNEWNDLINHIRESKSIATFKRNIFCFIKDN